MMTELEKGPDGSASIKSTTVHPSFMASAAPSTSATSFPLPQATPSAIPTPPEFEKTLSLLSSNRSVLGYLLLSRGQPVSIIRHSGVVFEGEHGRKYASAIAKIMDGVQSALEEVSGEVNEGDEVRFMRIRTKRHEIMISPDKRYLLAVLHDPTT